MESGFQCFSTKEINKPKFTDLMNILKEFQNAEEWLQGNKHESVFLYMCDEILLVLQ
jgi:hypothetical protein